MSGVGQAAEFATEDGNALPRFAVRLAPPALDAWRRGGDGIPGFVSRAGAAPGPHVVIVSLVHGNELAGAIVVDQLLASGLRPLRGTLSMGFANLAAFDRFDPREPTASRFVEEDLNRLWDPAVLDAPRHSSELSRAREMRPLIERADVLLDLHSMLWASEPLLLSGETGKGRALAEAIGVPSLVVADHGHVSGRRLIDYGGFADPAAHPRAVLVEAGQHWTRQTVDVTLACVAGLLRRLDMVASHPALPAPRAVADPAGAPPGSLGSAPGRFARVTHAITASTAAFSFARPFRGGEVVAQGGTLIALDGDVEVRTPYDDCLLVMPSLRPSRGHTAVRLARFED